MNGHDVPNLLDIFLLDTLKNLPVKFGDALVIIQTEVEPFEVL
jgi:hypothetical protein